MSKALDHLAARVTADPTFLAHPLAEYAHSAGLTDPQLAAELGCEPAQLTAVRLCGTPRPDQDGFRADLTTVATRFGLNLAALVKAVRHGQSVSHVRAAAASAKDAGWTIAARDRPEPESPPS
jgi:hypothetical protein